MDAGDGRNSRVMSVPGTGKGFGIGARLRPFGAGSIIVSPVSISTEEAMTGRRSVARRTMIVRKRLRVIATAIVRSRRRMDNGFEKRGGIKI